MKDALPNGGLLIRPATIRVTVLSPIQPETMGSVRASCQRIEKLYSQVLGNSASAALPFQARTAAMN
jgi:putative phosphoserine phosphatase/1-acylglycerol-3-phosphate O-acyltransferase